MSHCLVTYVDQIVGPPSTPILSAVIGGGYCGSQAAEVGDPMLGYIGMCQSLCSLKEDGSKHCLDLL